MKTPSFLELRSLVEYLTEELRDSQLQEVISTDEGLVLSFYRFSHVPHSLQLTFDLNRTVPFLGFFNENPWRKVKKTKPVALFLSAHGKNKKFSAIKLVEDLGRVVRLTLGEESSACTLEFRLIPKATNLLVSCGDKSISWYPVKELGQHEKVSLLPDEEVRTLAYLMAQWSRNRGMESSSKLSDPLSGSAFEKWKSSRQRTFEKKQKAIQAICLQIDQFKNEEWATVGEHIKQFGLHRIPPEWMQYIDSKLSASQNMQRCFERSKAFRQKAIGAAGRLRLLELELEQLKDLSEEAFQRHLRDLSARVRGPSAQREVAGRLRKNYLPEYNITAYLGKSAADNMELLRRSRPHDLWMHLKDYPSAHAIIHLNKSQKVPDQAVVQIGQWLLKEGLQSKYTQGGGKFSVVLVECRHVKPLKGDKLGRVTYHNAREMLIAI